MRNSSRWIAILGAVIVGATAMSAVPAGAQGLTIDEGNRPRWWFGVGGFSGENTLGRPEGQGSRLAGLGTGHDVSPLWRFGGDLLSDSQRYDTPTAVAAPLFGSVDSAVDVAAVGLVGTARYPLPFAGLQWYGGGGAGLYRSSVSGSAFGLPGRYDETDTSVGLHAEAGLSLPVSSATELGLSLRRVWLRSDFGSVTGGSVDIGGRFIFLGLRYTQ